MGSPPITWGGMWWRFPVGVKALRAALAHQTLGSSADLRFTLGYCLAAVESSLRIDPGRIAVDCLTV